MSLLAESLLVPKGNRVIIKPLKESMYSIIETYTANFTGRFIFLTLMVEMSGRLKKWAYRRAVMYLFMVYQMDMAG